MVTAYMVVSAGRHIALIDPVAVANYTWQAYANESVGGAQPDDERRRELVRQECARRFTPT